MQQPLEALKNLLQSEHRFLLIAHKSPDGDAVGSVAGMYYLLKNLGRKVEVVLPDPPASNIAGFLEGIDCLFYSSASNAVENRFMEADCLICLDFNAISRVGDMQHLLAGFQGNKVLIDHHTEPENFADITISEVSCSSTCQLIYECIEGMDLLSAVDQHAARCLYLGITTDTGSFR